MKKSEAHLFVEALMYDKLSESPIFHDANELVVDWLIECEANRANLAGLKRIVEKKATSPELAERVIKKLDAELDHFRIPEQAKNKVNN